MLFSFRTILSVTFLAGLVPLSVFGAPLSQVEDGIVRRNNAGDKFTVDDHEHTLGEWLGGGSTAQVHAVEGHNHLVAKVFNKEGVTPKSIDNEVTNLGKVGEFHGQTDPTEVGGQRVILATKHTGKMLEHTDAWKNADTPAKRKVVTDKAKELVIARNQHHADTHGFVHSDVNHGNVLYHKDEKGIHSAHFIDWGLGHDAVKDANGEYDKATKKDIRTSGYKATHDVTPHVQPANTNAVASGSSNTNARAAASGSSGRNLKRKASVSGGGDASGSGSGKGKKKKP